jgi:hypothetical protein
MNTWEGVLGVDENFNMEWAPLFCFNMYVQHGWSWKKTIWVDGETEFKQKGEKVWVFI